MKKIFSSIIKGDQMAEINEAEYGHEWDSVEAYILNAVDDLDGITLGTGIPGDILQDFGGMDPEQITALYRDGQPAEIWWMAEEE